MSLSGDHRNLFINLTRYFFLVEANGCSGCELHHIPNSRAQ